MSETAMEYSDKSGRIETASKESDDSDDEIIVKTTSWPTYQAPSKDSNGSDYTDKDIKNFEVNDESGGNHDTDDGVTNKAPRRRMNFHSSSDCSSAPAKSCSNNHYSSSCEHLHHKPQTSTKKANHQELSEDNNSKLQSNSESTQKKAFCRLN